MEPLFSSFVESQKIKAIILFVILTIIKINIVIGVKWSLLLKMSHNYVNYGNHCELKSFVSLLGKKNNLIHASFHKKSI